MSDNVIKSSKNSLHELPEEVEKKLLSEFFTAIQPHLYYISKEMERRGIHSIAPWINSSGRAGLYLNGYNFYIREDGTPIMNKETVLGVPFPDVNV